ncbi:MAG: hypothetical protein H7125_16585 [Proteobacteria bacterium]|nr:hypothetical protein [Burkholderiales bacterium]
MRDLLLLAIHLLVTVAKLLRPGGVRAVAAESLLLKQQIIIGTRSRRRAPNLTWVDRCVLGLLTLFVKPHRIPKVSAMVKASTLFKLHKTLVDRKYRLLTIMSDNPRRHSGDIRNVQKTGRDPLEPCDRIGSRGWMLAPRVVE